MKDTDQIEAFYDQFSRRLLTDYVSDNPRARAAIEYTIRWLPVHSQRILDVGCGIGWSTWEIKRHHPDAWVTGLDLSPRLIGTAQRLFQVSGLTFTVQDVTNAEVLHRPTCDAIAMLDVYEHIPRGERAAFHRALRATLYEEGVVILSFPSVSHQQFLREHRPDGLQPVDEDVTRDDIERLADDIGCELVDWEPVSIWRPEDYIHVTLRRGARDTDGAAGPKDGLRTIRLESRLERADRVRSRLGFRVTKDGRYIAHRPGPAVCIVCRSRDAYSETFIQAHVERLPTQVEVLYGKPFPLHRGDGRPLLRYGLPHRLLRSARRRFFGLTQQDFRDEAWRRFFLDNSIDVVLAEYGLSGVAVLDACREAGIPLIVHFHGFDAYDQKVLEGAGKRYPELFDYASAVIAVSQDMERQLVQLGAPREKVKYNPYGVDIDLFRGGDPASASPIFLAVGRFVDKKAPQLTLLAFSRVMEAVPEARLLMMGDGHLWEACKQLADALDIRGSVDFLGVRPHTEVTTAMRRARAFVQHSVTTGYGDSEGTPVGILEAGASGLPVVATKHAGIPDVVVDGETGLLVNEGDVIGMGERMLKLARDPELADRLGRAARQRISTHFTMESSIAKLWHIIEDVL
jgi:glycosyltransferase involved in cell wall biosynthesis